MSGFCGWIGSSEHYAANDVLAAMAQGLVGEARLDNIQQTESGHAIAVARSTSLSRPANAGILAAVEGHPWWRDTDLAAIAASEGNAAALAAAYQRDGRDCLMHLAGGWAAIVIDADASFALAGIDRIGIQPLCYAAIDGGAVFGTTADSLRFHPAVDTSIDYQSVYNLTYFTRIPSPATIFTGISKLQPGEALEISANVATVRRYDRWNYANKAHLGEDAFAEELRAILRRSVARCLEGTNSDEVGAYLSGGVDSSTVAGLLAEVAPAPPQAFTVGFDAEGFDETEFATAAAKHFGVEHRVVYVTPQDIVEFLPKMADIYDEPFANGSAVPAFYCTRHAKQHGIRVMLAGDGGDELFAGNERYVEQRVYDYYYMVPAWLRAITLVPLAAILPDNAPGPFGKAKRYIQRSRIPMPDRIKIFNLYGLTPVDEIFEPDFARFVDTNDPFAVMRRHYGAPAEASQLDRMMYLDLQTTIADDDLRKVNRTAEANGIDVRYPMLDDELIAFSTTLPEEIQLRDGQLRGFFKYAMRDFLPESTLTKSKHGFGLPFDLWIRTDPPLRDFVYGKLDELRQRRIFRSTFIDSMIAAHRAAESNSFGDVLWTLTLLELWFQTRGYDAHFPQSA